MLGQVDLSSDVPPVEASRGQEVNLLFGQPLGQMSFLHLSLMDTF